MKTVLTGLKKQYTSGDTVRCHLKVTGGERVISSDIKLVQSDRERIRGPDVRYPDGSYGPGHMLSKPDYTILSEPVNNVNISGPFGGEIMFKIPDDATNTSEKYGDFPLYGQTAIGIRVFIKYVTRKGREIDLDDFYHLNNKRFVTVSNPVYKLVNEDVKNSRFSMLYRVSRSTFLPGESVDIDVVYIPKTRATVKSLSVYFVSRGQYTLKVKSKKFGFFLKSLKNKNMSKEEEYEYMKNAIDMGLGNKFTLKLPKNLHEDTRKSTVLMTNIKTFFDDWGDMKNITTFNSL